MKQLQSKKGNLVAATEITPRGFLVAAVSQYDAFLGGLIKAMYHIKPEMLNSSEKKLTFANLTEFGSLDSAREFILEKEVESVLRESHSKHFDWLEGKLKTTLRKGLDIWPEFIELTERRNLFVHTAGEVSYQYIQVCSENNVVFDREIIVGEKLWVDPEYFQRACDVLIELSTKLTQVIWRKLKPDDLELADRHLNEICYELLKEEKYDLAQRLLQFALSLPRHSSQSSKLTFIVNISIAYKWGVSPEKAAMMISSTDWSACNDTFRLVSSVLLDKFEEAAEIMKKIGPDGEVGKAQYKD